MRTLIGVIIALVMAVSFSYALEMPHAGQPTSPVKALSAEDLEGYLKGSGMGMSKVAELNSYPGPKHVIELADKMSLTEEQLVRTRELYDEMHKEAMEIGALIVERERALDRFFASREVDSERLEPLLSEIGALKGSLRFVHVRAHLKQTSILSEEQVKGYNTLRGYDTLDNTHEAH